MTHDAVRDISVNYTDVWIREIDPRQSGYYIDSFLLIMIGGVPWQVREGAESKIESQVLLVCRSDKSDTNIQLRLLISYTSCFVELILK